MGEVRIKSPSVGSMYATEGEFWNQVKRGSVVFVFKSARKNVEYPMVYRILSSESQNN